MEGRQMTMIVVGNKNYIAEYQLKVTTTMMQITMQLTIQTTMQLTIQTTMQLMNLLRIPDEATHTQQEALKQTHNKITIINQKPPIQGPAMPKMKTHSGAKSCFL